MDDNTRPTPRTLIIFASKHGQTEKIAYALAKSMNTSVSAAVVNVKDSDDIDPSHFDSVVVAASVHEGNHQRSIVDWVRQNREQVERLPGAFISVSLTAAEDSDEAKETTAKLIDDFKRETGWWPDRSDAVAGALQYREYDVFTRLFMRLLMKREGHPTDTSQDVDYTDWKALDSLGREIGELFASSPGEKTLGG